MVNISLSNSNNNTINSGIMITIIVYLIVIATLIFCFMCEKRDINCKDLKGKECGVGMGRAYANHKPTEKDDIEKLISKARLTMRYEASSIFWRRSFVAATAISFLILFMMKNKVPSGTKFLMAFMVTYVVLYLVFTLFQRWVTEPATKQMDSILDAIERKSIHRK